jgi:hypothetical protein
LSRTKALDFSIMKVFVTFSTSSTDKVYTST